jgi:DNA-directed RNA polymerase subunit alpha
MEENGSVTVDSLMARDSLAREDIDRLRKLVYGSEKNRTLMKKALEKLDSDSSAKRNSAKAYKLALAYWFADRDDEALKLLRKHLKSADAYITYVGWCIIKERFSEAHETALKGLKEHKKNTELLLLGAQAAVKAGMIQEGEKVARKVEKALAPLDLEGLRSEPAQEEEQVEEDAAGEEAEDGEEEAAERPRYPEHSSLFYLQGLIREASGEWDEAIEKYDDAIAADRENILAYFRKAYNLDLRGMDEEALETYEKARRLRPLHINVLFNLGVLYEDAGKNRKAIQIYRTILEDRPTHARAKLFLKDSQSSRHMVYDEEEEKEQDKLMHVLNTPITDFELSVRSRNCLAKMNIKTLGDLSRKTESELLSYKNFGETSLAEIKSLLATKGLTLGMSTDDYGRSPEPEDLVEEEEEEAGKQPDLLDTPLSTVHFSVRCRRAFEKLSLTTLRELADTSEAEFQALRNFGQTSLSEIKTKLAEYGLVLKGS